MLSTQLSECVGRCDQWTLSQFLSVQYVLHLTKLLRSRKHIADKLYFVRTICAGGGQSIVCLTKRCATNISSSKTLFLNTAFMFEQSINPSICESYWPLHGRKTNRERNRQPFSKLNLEHLLTFLDIYFTETTLQGPIRHRYKLIQLLLA